MDGTYRLVSIATPVKCKLISRARPAVNLLLPLWSARKCGARGVVAPRAALQPRSDAANDEGSELRAVNIAIVSNVLIFTAKLCVSSSSGSSSMLAEAVHTLADIGNQLLLRLGIARSRKAPNDRYPYGYLKDKYIFSLISAVGVFCIGAGASLINGAHALADADHEVEKFGLSFAVLAVSFLVEGFSCVVAVRTLHAGAARRGVTFLEHLDSGDDPAAVAVMAEDGAAVVGVTTAGLATGLVRVTGWQAWDGIGSCLVGVLLAFVALFLIQRNRSVLIGRAMSPDDLARVLNHLNRDEVVNHVYDARSEEIGPGVYRFSAEIDFNGDAIAARHLSTIDAAALQTKFYRTRNDANERDPRAFRLVLMEYGVALVHAVGAEIDRIELEIQNIVPGVRYVDLEADRGRFSAFRGGASNGADATRRSFDISNLSWDDVAWERESDRIAFLLAEGKAKQDTDDSEQQRQQQRSVALAPGVSAAAERAAAPWMGAPAEVPPSGRMVLPLGSESGVTKGEVQLERNGTAWAGFGMTGTEASTKGDTAAGSTLNVESKQEKVKQGVDGADTGASKGGYEK